MGGSGNERAAAAAEARNERDSTTARLAECDDWRTGTVDGGGRKKAGATGAMDKATVPGGTIQTRLK